MFAFITGVLLAVSAMTGAFEQGQKNPEASGFLDSKSTAIEQEVFIVDTL